jgi:hypothetical protein
MNENECLKEKISSRMIGFIILPFAMIMAFVGPVLVPVFGFLLSVPVLILAVVFIAAPESKVCRLITGKKG